MICASVRRVLMPYSALDRAQRRVVQVEEAVAVAQRLELLLPDRELQLAELGARHVLSETMPMNASTLVDVCRRSPSAARRASCGARRRRRPVGRVAAERDHVAVDVAQRDEVEDVRIVDRVPGSISGSFGNWSVASPVIAVNEGFGARP